MKPFNKIEYPDAKESPYQSTGYGKVPDARDVIRNIRGMPRAEQPSPLLQEWMRKQVDGKK